MTDPVKQAEDLLEVARTRPPGWAQPYGGAAGVAELAEHLRQDVLALADKLLALRSAAVAAGLDDESLADAARRLGLTRSAVHKAHRDLRNDNPYLGDDW